MLCTQLDRANKIEKLDEIPYSIGGFNRTTIFV